MSKKKRKKRKRRRLKRLQREFAKLVEQMTWQELFGVSSW